MKELKFILICLSLIYFCSCSKQKFSEKELYSYDFIKHDSLNQIELINLDSVKNYSELKELMENIACNKKVTGITFKTDNTKYYMTGYTECPNDAGGCYFNKINFIIKNDTILNDFKNPKKNKTIENLKSEIDSAIAQPYNYKYEQNKLNSALIHFYVEDHHPISLTKEVLKEIANQFLAVNTLKGSDFFEYYILFEGDWFHKRPPPPPRPIPIESE